MLLPPQLLLLLQVLLLQLHPSVATASVNRMAAWANCPPPAFDPCDDGALGVAAAAAAAVDVNVAADADVAGGDDCW